MADEHSESAAHGSSNSGDDYAADRAAFLAGGLDDGAKADDGADSDADADADGDVDADADADLDEVASDDADDDVESEADEDADLDEEDDEDKKDDEKDVDSETAKRLAQVRRTDQRLRERRDQEFAKREAELAAREEQIAEELRPHLAKVEKFEKAASRVNIDPAGVLMSLGLTEDRYEHAAQVLYTLAKSKDDPKAKAAVAQLMKDRERDEQIEKLTKSAADREEQERQREKQAAADRQLDEYFGKVAKATSDKTPLAAAFLKSNPTAAREQMEILAFRIAKEAGSLPKERDVVIALEKNRRSILRDLGIDPKTVSAKKATAAIAASNTTTTKKATDKTAPVTKDKKPAAKATDETLSAKEEFLRLGTTH